jgi:hypothetical protein
MWSRSSPEVSPQAKSTTDDLSTWTNPAGFPLLDVLGGETLIVVSWLSMCFMPRAAYASLVCLYSAPCRLSVWLTRGKM